jgi:hypothetical protein
LNPAKINDVQGTAQRYEAHREDAEKRENGEFLIGWGQGFPIADY